MTGDVTAKEIHERLMEIILRALCEWGPRLERRELLASQAVFIASTIEEHFTVLAKARGESTPETNVANGATKNEQRT